MSNKPTIVLYGDCQAMVLSHGLRKLPEITDRFDVVHLWAVKPGEPPEPVSPIASEAWKRCEAFWVQIGTTVPPAHYVAEAPDRRITFSALYLPFTHPFLAADLLMRPSVRHPMRFGYSDPFLAELSETDLTGDAIYYRWEELQQRQLLAIDRVVESGTRLMVERDAQADVRLAGWAIAHTSERRLVWTRAHVAEAMSALQLDRLLRATFGHEVNPRGRLFGAGARAFSELHALSAQQDPVSWTTANHLGLGWWRPDYRYRIQGLGKAMTLREFVVEYVTDRRRKLAEQREAGAASQVAAE
jgi:hypothetical protein